jgi:hypothetical protein
MSGQLNNTAQSDLLILVFQNTNWANIGDATGLRGSTTAGSFYIQLHTADPTATGNQTSFESAYTNYARQAVARSSGGWTVTGSSPTIAENAAAITFPQSGSSETETHSSLGRASSSTGEILWYGPLGASLAVASLITPSFAINAWQAKII